MARALDAKPQVTNARADFYHRIDEENMTPLWEVLSQLLTREPQVGAKPYLWKYDELRHHIMEAGQLISAAEAERRVLVLENPGLRGQSRITEALYAGLQLIMPGELAPAHRHSPCALRYIQEGSGAYTAVNGEKAYMEPGDLILTPSWTWHDHGHEGKVPVVWLDGLDLPLIKGLGPMFAEPYGHEQRYPERLPVGDGLARYGAGLLPVGTVAADQNSPQFHYPYERTREALAQLVKADEWDKVHGIKMEFVNPVTGGPVMPTISCYMQVLAKGMKTAPYRTTASWVYACREGKGRTIVGDTTLEWKPRDVFVVPCWMEHRHESDAESVLFSVSDARMQQKLGIWREVRGNA
ncbi:MAG TPA: gentisate 1,2-dioxygenase [Alphaproteobacteria bacterium]